MCGGDVDIQILKKRFIADSVSNKYKIGEYLAQLPAIRWLSRTRCTHGHHTAKRRRKCTHRLACNFAKCSMIKKN